MSNDPYSAEVREYFNAPAHAGDLDGAARVATDDQGVRVHLSALIEADAVTRLRFLAWGCPHLIAACEAFCREFEGLPAAELLEFSASDLMQSLSVPAEKTGRILVLEDAVRSLGSVLGDASIPE